MKHLATFIASISKPRFALRRSNDAEVTPGGLFFLNDIAKIQNPFKR